MNLHNLPKSVQDHILHLERMRRDFVANISHELRTPLTVIQGYLETLLQPTTVENSQFKTIFEQMFHHSARMANIIEDLLLLSALESEEYKILQTKKIPIYKMLKILLSVVKKNINLH
jgi:two-component system, OmpR family, phosphate regulon sensor histidine kinase PhoR